MAFQVTQCPSCESTFNTNPGLLDMAGGKVRCGACLTVFLAEENFIDTNLDQSEDEQESVFIGGQPAEFFDPSQFLTRSALIEEPQEFLDEQIQVSVDMETEPVPGLAAQESFLPPDETESSITDVESDEHLEFFAAIDEGLQQSAEPDDITDLQQIAALDPNEDEEQQHFDPFVDSDDESAVVPDTETTQLELPDAEEPELSSPETPDTRPEEFSLNASFAMQFGTTTSKPEDSSPEPEQHQEIVDTSETPADDISAREQEEIDNLEAQVREAIEEQDFSAAVEAGLKEEPGVEHEAEEQSLEEESEPELDTSTEAIRARALQQELEDEEALEQIPRENLSSLKQIAPPVQLIGGRQRSLGKTFAMLVLILLLGGALAGQYLWRYKDTYSVDPRFRTAYQFVCGQLDCELPEYTAIDAIRSDNLAVRSHPEREDGLMVTVEIRNTAEFPQRFPILILGFNSANNQLIALREFAAEEYLDEGLQQIEFMPVASPVQVSIPIMDPGSDAVNYTLAFRSP